MNKIILAILIVVAVLQTAMVFQLQSNVSFLEANGFLDVSGAKAQGDGQGGGGMVGSC